MGKPGVKYLTMRMPSDVHKAMKIRCAEDEKSVGEVVEGLIRQYLVGGVQEKRRKG